MLSVLSYILGILLLSLGVILMNQQNILEWTQDKNVSASIIDLVGGMIISVFAIALYMRYFFRKASSAIKEKYPVDRGVSQYIPIFSKAS
jgi:NADH:ubiquinone oxidoreductase subunit 6 (subunit J)